jgi:4-amino-4-deoxy-L-arabinose transferase-like glycosyltransferase
MAAEDTRGSEVPPREAAKRNDRLFLAGVFLVALGIRLVAAWASGVAAPQEIRYITIAQGILSGRGFSGIDARFPDLIQPPVYAVLIAFSLIFCSHPLAAARGLSAIMGALLVLPLSAITKRLFSDATARRTAWLIAFYPLLVHISALCMTEPTFSVFVALTVLLVVKGTSGEREKLCFGLAGVFLGLGFLTRPEGIADTAATCALLFYWAWRRRGMSFGRALAVAMYPGVICMVVAAPYWIWLHGKTDTWLLAPKVALTEVHQAIMNQGVQEHWPEPYGSRIFYERVKFGLTPNGMDFLSSEAFRNLGLIHGDAPRSALKAEPAKDVGLKRLAWIVLRNVKQLYLDTIKYGLVLPTLLLGFLALGITSRPWRAGTERFGQGTILWFALSGCSWVLSYVEARFLYPSIVFLIPWMAEGWGRAEIWLRDSIGVRTDRGARIRDTILAWGLLVLVAVACFVHIPPPVTLFSSIWAEHQAAGKFLKDSGLEPGPIMALTPVTSFYAGYPFEMLPYADLDRVIAYARSRGVRYLVADMAEFPTDRPQLMSLFDPSSPHPGLRLLHDIDRNPARRVVIYALERFPEEGDTARAGR